MSNPSNTSSVNLSNNLSTTAQNYFNNYFNGTLNITSNQNDAVDAYFQELTNGNVGAAQILASTVIYTAISQGLDPMSIIQQLQEVAPGELNLYLAMFLNLNRVGTSLVGVNNTPVVNKYITRAILA
jgi:hypothetical protein